jgi:hypothetical protein
MELLDRLRERVTGGIGWLVVSVRELRLDEVKQRAVALWAARGQVSQSRGVLIGATAVVLGAVVVLTVRNAASQSGERDFKLPVVCAECGYSFFLSRDEMIDRMAAARNKGYATAGRDTATPLCLCPKCGKLAVYRARECPKCGKPVPPEFATVDGVRIVPKCRACGWSAKPSGG